MKFDVFNAHKALQYKSKKDILKNYKFKPKKTKT